MDTEVLWKITAAMCLVFGIYCIAAAILVVAFEALAFFIIFALIFLAFGILYILAGASMLRKGTFGPTAFIGVFGVMFWYGPGLPWYIWPMIIMPIIITMLFVVLFFKGHFDGRI